MSMTWIMCAAGVVAGLMGLAWATSFVVVQIQAMWTAYVQGNILRAEARLQVRQVKAKDIANERQIVDAQIGLLNSKQELERRRNTKLTDEIKERDKVAQGLKDEISRLNEDMRKMRMGIPEAPKVDVAEIARVVVEKLKAESLLPVTISVDPEAIAADVSNRVNAELVGLKNQVTDVGNLVAAVNTDTSASDQLAQVVSGLESQVIGLRDHLVAEGADNKTTLQEMRGSIASFEKGNAPVDGSAIAREVHEAVAGALEGFRASLTPQDLMAQA